MTIPASALRLPARSTPAGGAVAEKREKDSLIPSIELLQGMTLSAFRASRLVVVVRCAVLGDEVVWAADDTSTARRGGFDDQGRVIYSGDELRLLLAFAAHPEDLVAYHRMRQAVGRVEVESLTWEDPAKVEALAVPLNGKKRTA